MFCDCGILYFFWSATEEFATIQLLNYHIYFKVFRMIKLLHNYFLFLIASKGIKAFPQQSNESCFFFCFFFVVVFLVFFLFPFFCLFVFCFCLFIFHKIVPSLQNFLSLVNLAQTIKQFQFITC